MEIKTETQIIEELIVAAEQQLIVSRLKESWEFSKFAGKEGKELGNAQLEAAKEKENVKRLESWLEFLKQKKNAS